VQQIYRATGDLEWLKTQAFPVVKGIAEWLVSRVSKDPSDGSLHINGVMPIDEWCNQGERCTVYCVLSALCGATKVKGVLCTVY
jgi:trehalose/maltose hydrolase-like predicted phosphorylase